MDYLNHVLPVLVLKSLGKISIPHAKKNNDINSNAL